MIYPAKANDVERMGFKELEMTVNIGMKNATWQPFVETQYLVGLYLHVFLLLSFDILGISAHGQYINLKIRNIGISDLVVKCVNIPD